VNKVNILADGAHTMMDLGIRAGIKQMVNYYEVEFKLSHI